MSHSTENRPYGNDGVWPSLNRFLLTLIVLSAAVPIGFSFLPEVKKRKEHETRIEELKAEIDNQRMLLARHRREESLLNNDPEYVGLIARDRLDLMKEGETIYRLEPPKIDPSRFRLKQ